MRSLLLIRDDNTIRIIRRVFSDLDVKTEHFSDASAALLDASRNRYEAIVVDDYIEQAAAVVERLLELPSCNKSVRIVLAKPVAQLNTVFQTGTQVILYKPLSLERVRHGLRAVRNLMARDRRRGAGRVSTMVPARLNFGKISIRQVLIADLSDSGAALHCATGDLPTCGNLNLEFTLPGDAEALRATAELVWQDSDGAAGVRFLDMALYARKRLAKWLKDNAEKDSHAAALASRAGR